MIPISDELMSVGVVLPRDVFKPLPRARARDAAAAVDRRHAGRGPPDDARRAALAGARRARLLLRRARLRRRSLDRRRRRRVVSRSGVLDRRGDRAGVRARRARRPSMPALARGDLSARAFRRFDRRQRARYQSFRRFVRGFYTPRVPRSVLQPDPPPRLFRARRHRAGRATGGRRSITRFWVWLFFLSVRLQARLRFAPSHLH